MTDHLKDKLTAAIKVAMRAHDKQRLTTLRMVMAEIKRREIDEQVSLDEVQILAVINKMLKQRHDSIAQFQAAGRQDLVDKERAEVEILQTFMPEPLSTDEIAALIQAALTETGAAGMKDIGKVMAVLKPKLVGRADMTSVSREVKTRLSK